MALGEEPFNASPVETAGVDGPEWPAVSQVSSLRSQASGLNPQASSLLLCHSAFQPTISSMVATAIG